MKRIKNFLRNHKKALKEKSVARKKRVADEREERLDDARIESAAQVLGISNTWSMKTMLKNCKRDGSNRISCIDNVIIDAAGANGNTVAEIKQARYAARATRLPRRRKFDAKRIVFYVVAGIVALLLIVWALGSFSKPKPNTITIINDNPTVTASSDSLQCNNSWMMEAAPFEIKDNKLYADGLQMIQEAKFGKSSENNEKALEALQMYRNKKIYLLDMAQSELSPEAWAKVNPNDISDTGSCANEITNKLYQDVIFEVMHSQSSIENLPSPNTWYNSGLSKGKIVVDGQRGITGNVKALVIRHRDGRVTAYLARCGNRVHKDQKGYDKGDTDEDHHKDQPKCTKNCKPKPPLTPKSSNPKDYKQPGDDNTRDSGTGTKPKATVSTPAESTPPAVNTSKSGGGGVIDTPTNKPGSETGTTAKGASPAPPAPSTPKPNEGGTNNGTVTD